MRDLLDLLRMGATQLVPRGVARRRFAAAYRGYAPQPLWGTAYHAMRLLRNVVLVGR